MTRAAKKLYTGAYFSVSRVKHYEKCALSFKYCYIDKAPRGTSEPAEFGKLVHAALQKVFEWVVDEEFKGKIPDEVMLAKYQDAFQESTLADNALYQEGVELLRTYFRLHPTADHREVLAIEREFTIMIDGKVKVLGYIDRIDRLNSDTIEIIDYKTNRMMFSREEMDADLQMSVYGLAAFALWPWVKNIRYRFDMVRHSMSLYTSRQGEDLDFAAAYMIALHRRLAEQTDYPAQINALCGWCDYRDGCKEYNKALKGHGLQALVAVGDIERICEERQSAAAIEKIAKGRKQEMDKLIKSHIGQGKKEEVVVGGVRFKLQTKFSTHYPPQRTLKVLSAATGTPVERLSDMLLVIDGKVMDQFIKDQELPKSKKQLLGAQLVSLAHRSPHWPFVSARKVAKRK
jgi:RecB family exonuclease